MQGRFIAIKSKNVVLALSVCALLIPVLLIEFNVLAFTNGIFVYPLDDIYIHMSIAENLAQHANWGISSNEFQSASSSILYTLLLSGFFKLFSVHTIIPFIINLIAGIILLFVIQSRLQKENISYNFQLLILFLAIFFTPLPTLIISGMEHTLQCLFFLLFIFSFCDWVEAAQNITTKKAKLPGALFFYGMILCALRYEGLFVIATACCILLYYKKIIASFSLGFVSILPLIIFGIFSVMKGSYMLPNSVLLKSSPVQLSGSGFMNYISDILIDKLTLAQTGITALATQRLLLILPLALLLFRKHIKNSAFFTTAIVILFSCTVLQLAFAKTGWLYRYEAYLVLGAIVLIFTLWIKYFKQLNVKENKLLYFSFLIVTCFLFFPLILRSIAANAKTEQACINIYEQQYQMGNFVKKYYDTSTVALNDIGAVSFFSKARVIDLWGLANIDVAKAKKNNEATPAFLNEVSREENVNLALVYDSWFDSSLLNKWQKVATWTIANNVICGDATVSFYSLRTNADVLKKNISDYKQLMPKDIEVKIY